MITVPQIANIAVKEPILYEALRRLVSEANAEFQDVRNSVGITPDNPTIEPMWFNVRDYGAVGDGTGDDTAAIVAAVADASISGGIVYFPCGIYPISAQITVGDGTVNAASTIDGVVLLGETPTTTLKWIAASVSTGSMVKLAGPILGCGITNLAIDCNSLCYYGVTLYHPANCTFRNVDVRTPYSVGWIIENSHENHGGLSPRQNVFENCGTTCAKGVNRVGWRIGSPTVGPSPHSAFTHNTFTGCYANMTGTALGTGMELAYCYSNRFVNTMLLAYAPLQFGAVVGTPDYPGTQFPADNEFIGVTGQGGDIGTFPAWTGSHPNLLWPYRTINSNAPTQAHRHLIGITSDGLWLGKPKGVPLRCSTVSASSTITNPATATSFTVSHTLEPYVLHQVGTVLKLHASGSCTLNADTTLKIEFKLGSTTVWGATTASIPAGSYSWFAEAPFTMTAIGSGTIRRDMGLVACSTFMATPTAGSPISLDTTSAYAATPAVTIGTPDAATTVTCNCLRVEVLYPKETI